MHPQESHSVRSIVFVFNPSIHLTCVSVEEVENGLRTFLYIRTTGFTTKTGHRQKKLGSLIQKSRETAARTGPNRMVGAFHHTNDECEGSVRSAMLHATLHSTGMLPCNQQTLHAWLLKTLPPTVQTPCKNSIAFPNASSYGDMGQRRYFHASRTV